MIRHSAVWFLSFTMGIFICCSLTSSIAQGYQISVKQKPGKMRIGVVDPDSMYEAAGLQRNDVIKEINGKKVDDTTPVSMVDDVVRNGGRITIERDGKTIKKKLKPADHGRLIESDTTEYDPDIKKKSSP